MSHEYSNPEGPWGKEGKAMASHYSEKDIYFKPSGTGGRTTDEAIACLKRVIADDAAGIKGDLTGYVRPTAGCAEYVKIIPPGVPLTPEQIKFLEDEGGGAVKADVGKLRLDLFPGDALFAISDILTFGANKYTDRNWEKGMKWSRPFGALMRHMWAWWGGQETDQETGKSHLWHAGCCIVFLIAYEMRGVGADDRPQPGAQGRPRTEIPSDDVGC